MLLGLAFRNIWRQPIRTALSLSSIAFAAAITVFLLSLQRGAYGTMKENVLRLMDGFAQIQPPSFSEDPDLRKTIADPRPLSLQFAHLPAVTAAAPRAQAYAILSNGPRSYGAAVIGVDPSTEGRVTRLGATITHGRYLEAGDGPTAVVGAGLARDLKLSVGSRFTMLGAARDGSAAADILTVTGIFATGSPELDREVIEMPLQRFQSDFAMDGNVNVIAVGGAHLSDIGAVVSRLQAMAGKDGLVVRDWTELEPALNDVILLDASFSLLIYATLVIVAVFIILNTLLMSVLERTHEFGMMMAIGMRPSQIGRMVWLELFLLALIGATLGIAIGCAATAWTAVHGIPFPSAEALFSQWHMPSTLYPQLDWLSALAGPLAIVVSIIVAGLVPYLRVRRLEAVSAMASA
jgi:ABC-type lipoprotein release transport system permease subunit